MKSCPRCDKGYPDSEIFCETDGTALVAGAPGHSTGSLPDTDAQALRQGDLECPVCGGKAQPGEVICNFCGARLGAETPDRTQSAFPRTSGTAQTASFENNPGPQEFGDEPPYPADQPQGSKRRISTVLGFSIAALVALAAGAWLALYLSNRHPSSPPLAQTSPSPSAALPTVELAKGIPLQVQGGPLGASDRDLDSLRKVFEANRTGLSTVYKNALNSDSSMRDGMVVRLHVLPDGTVDNGAVSVSTAANPSFDAEVIEAMTSWKFAPGAASAATVDYPVIFAPGASDAAVIESGLNAKLAGLSLDEAPEYAFSPSGPSPSPAVAAASSPAMPSSSPAASPSEMAGIPAIPPATLPSPALAPPETATRPARPRRRHRTPREMAAVPPPKPPLIQRVDSELKASRKLRRVHAYTNGSVVTIFGKVFDDKDRTLAERTVRNIDGVTTVINNVTTDTQEWAHNQASIAQALQNAGLTEVNIKVIGSNAYLSGQVKNELDRERAVTIAQAAAPVRVRENLITVAVGSMFGF